MSVTDKYQKSPLKSKPENDACDQPINAGKLDPNWKSISELARALAEKAVGK